MRRSGSRSLAIALGLVLAPGAVAARAEGQDPETSAFAAEVAPLLRKYCVACHGPEKHKGGINFARYKEAADVNNDRKTWEKVLENVESGLMPPEDEAQPTPGEAATLTAWVEARLSKAECVGPIEPGRVTLRRLNRAEYNNTVHDLLAIDFQPADDFPVDDVGYGFDNIGDVLTLSPILMEKYLAAAEAIAERAIRVGGPRPGPLRRWEAESAENSDGEPTGGDARILPSTGEVRQNLRIDRGGDFRLRVRAWGQQAGKEPVKLAFRIDGKELKTVDVEAVEGDPKVFEVTLNLNRGKHDLAVAFLNDYYNPDDPDPENRDRNLVLDYLELQGPAEVGPPILPESHRRIIFRQPSSDSREDRLACARELLERFASRAFRRPASAEDVERLVGFVGLALDDGESFERGMQLAIEAALVSPRFLFKVEVERPSESPGTPRPIDDFELATRLSYFLWSSMPDEELFELARRGRLHDQATLDVTVRRMLASPKAKALVLNFADQWLQIRNLRTFSPDPERFPGFDEELRSAMRQETEEFFGAVMREDRSILEFLDADYTFLNERLAKHYGIPDVEGSWFRRVELPADRVRGGVLTQASVLTVTSNPTRTSPVKRGKWVLEQILGTPPPPPPPDVPELKEEGELKGSLRQRMEQHRANPSCASCHARMDPLGFGLENFDAVGAWRDKDGEYPVDASGELPGGRTFSGPKELKAILKSQGPKFTAHLTETLLTYALGRGLEPEDACVVERISGMVAEDGHRFSRLVVEVAKSEPFRLRGAEGGPKQ